MGRTHRTDHTRVLGCDHAINLGQCDLRLGSPYAMLHWNTGALQTTGLLVQLSGTKRRNVTITGTNPAQASATPMFGNWTVLPRDEAYCGATPTERSPFFGIAVSSTTSTASLPPTRQRHCLGCRASVSETMSGSAKSKTTEVNQNARYRISRLNVSQNPGCHLSWPGPASDKDGNLAIIPMRGNN